MTTAQECAARGALLLDGSEPTWFEKVDPLTVNVHIAGLCPLSQVYGSYGEGCRRVFIHDPDKAVEHGFSCTTIARELHREYVVEINNAWREEIERRRAA